MQEEILLKKYRTGTTITYFDTLISPENYPVSSTPGALYLNSMGMPYLLISSSVLPGNSALTFSNGVEIWKVSGNDNIQRLQEVVSGGRVITGRTFSQDTERQITTSEFIQKSFLQEMQQKFSGQSESYVFVSPKVLEDFEVSFKLERTHDVLNTLSTYNKVYNDFPKRNAKTGVVFGKLEAVQKLKDENGNNIRIPLRGVPIGIFNPGNKFETVTSVDDNGNRIRLNFKETVGTSIVWPTPDYYANIISYDFDTQNFLPDKDEYIFDATSPLVSMPDEFKYTVLTNENGEFIIHDVPVGPQTLMFEVNLLQQGLTPDEVALNFFPYRGENISNIDEIPHFFFRQIPIDVVPVWGETQTGYTEVNVKANLDLRKWATYYLPPACNKIAGSAERFFESIGEVYNCKDEGDIDNIILDRMSYYNTEVNPPIWFTPYSDAFFKIGDPYLSRYIPAPLIVEVRNMALEGFPTTSIQMVQINNILERKGGEINTESWNNEFSQIRDRAEFRTFGYNAIKLPANIYDISAYRTNEKGVPKSGMYQKGVWLCSYQLKMYHTSKDFSYRATGFRHIDWNSNSTRDHFHLNVGYSTTINTTNILENISSKYEGAQFLNFPYERPWSTSYPNQYSIPQEPVDVINQYTVVNPANSSGYTVMEYPLFRDGHKIKLGEHMPTRNGNVATGGLAHAKFNKMTQLDIIGGWYSTSFSYSVTNSSLYHYELGPWTNYGKYANGYTQGENRFAYPDPITGPNTVVYPTSEVKNGEQYQRLEAGYGYYLHPEWMPRVGKSYGFDYTCEYDNRYAAYCSYNGGAGFTPYDSDFYFSQWNPVYGVVFDNGMTTALRLDYDNRLGRKMQRNQGAFSIYRIINPGAKLDPTQVFDLIGTESITSRKITLDLIETKIQREKTTNEKSRYKNDNTENDYNYWTSQVNTWGMLEKATIRITNNGRVNTKVRFSNGIMRDLIAGVAMEITAQELGRTWHNLAFTLESNDGLTSLPGGEWEYTQFKYTISFFGVTTRNHNSNDWVLCAGQPYTAVINSVLPNNSVYYARTRMQNVKALKKCGADSRNEKDITVEGLYFTWGNSTTPQGISFGGRVSNQSACDSGDNSGCYCSHDGGFYYGMY